MTRCYVTFIKQSQAAYTATSKKTVSSWYGSQGHASLGAEERSIVSGCILDFVIIGNFLLNSKVDAGAFKSEAEKEQFYEEI